MKSRNVRISGGVVTLRTPAPVAFLPSAPKRVLNRAPARRSMVSPSCALSQKDYEKFDIGAKLPTTYGDLGPNKPKNRRCGLILHPTSFPGPYGIGEIGTRAYKAVDWMRDAGFSLWQVCPLVPPERLSWSPYSGQDALCGNTLLIDLDDLVDDGLLELSELPSDIPFRYRANFNEVAKWKDPLLLRAAGRLLDARGADVKELKAEMEAWRAKNVYVEDSALFSILCELPEHVEKLWWEWDMPIRKRDPATLAKLREQYKKQIDAFVALQFLFDRQWSRLRAYANSQGLSVMGDMPIYVGGQSADVWANQDLFELGPDAQPLLVSGVPPDAFSETGQLWGSPLYNWPAHHKEGYKWWAKRMRRAQEMYDEIRIDHFRGFAGYWAVEATMKDAMIGDWVKGPGKALFDGIEQQIGKVEILAEDLGVITEDVKELRESIGAPGMVVLQFAWGGGSTNTHLPHNHYENCFAFVGTHDNDTTVGWWEKILEAERKVLRSYLNCEARDIAWDLMRAAAGSVCRTAIFTMPDIMRLDSGARFNTPGTIENNWNWRIGEGEVWEALTEEAQEMRAMISEFDRSPPPMPKVELPRAAEPTAPSPTASAPVTTPATAAAAPEATMGSGRTL